MKVEVKLIWIHLETKKDMKKFLLATSSTGTTGKHNCATLAAISADKRHLHLEHVLLVFKYVINYHCDFLKIISYSSSSSSSQEEPTWSGLIAHNNTLMRANYFYLFVASYPSLDFFLSALRQRDSSQRNAFYEIANLPENEREFNSLSVKNLLRDPKKCFKLSLKLTRDYCGFFPSTRRETQDEVEQVPKMVDEPKMVVSSHSNSVESDCTCNIQ